MRLSRIENRCLRITNIDLALSLVQSYFMGGPNATWAGDLGSEFVKSMSEATERASPPIWQTAVASWQSVLYAIRRLPRLTASAICVCFALYFVVMLLPSDGSWSSRSTGLVRSAAVFFGPIAITAALQIRVIRWVLLGETTDHYIWEPSRHLGVVSTWFGVLALFDRRDRIVEALGVSLPGSASTMIMIAAVSATVKLALIFPAIAIDAPGRGWRDAWVMSKGHFWRIGTTLACTNLIAVPLVLLLLFPLWMIFVRDSALDPDTGLPILASPTAQVTVEAIGAILLISWTIATSAALSIIYRSYAPPDVGLLGLTRSYNARSKDYSDASND